MDVDISKMNINDIDIIKYKEMAIMYASEYGLKILAAILIFVIGKWIAKKLTAVIKALMTKAKIDKTLTEFSESIVYFSLLLMVIIASLNQIGVNTTSFVAVFGAATLAIGLALQGSFANLGAAVLIILFRPFKVGDVIETAGVTGEVTDINLFSTVITPVDKSMVIIPNSSIINGNITNFSNRDRRRVDHIFGIGYDDDLKLAKETLINILNSDERILKEPAPFVAVNELAESSVNFVVRAWTTTDDYWDVYFDLLEKVKLTFDEKGISIPYPQMDVHTDKTNSTSK